MVRGSVDFPTPRPQTAQFGHDRYNNLNTSHNVHALSEISRNHGPWVEADQWATSNLGWVARAARPARPASAAPKTRYKQTDPTWVNPLGKISHGGARAGGWTKPGGWDEAEHRDWNDLISRQHRAVQTRTHKAASRPNSAAAATRNSFDRAQRIETAFHQCLADLPEIQRTNPAAFAGLRKLEAAKRRGQSREAAARATGDRLTATWTVARSGKSRNEFDHRERARSGGWTGNPYATPWNRPASPRG
jgi:hypothetical protein